MSVKSPSQNNHTFLLLKLELSWEVNELGLPHHTSILDYLMCMKIFHYIS